MEKSDEIIYEGYFGYADIGEKKKVDADTSFYIASVTKPYFSLAMLMEEHRGRVSESTNMATMFPDMKFSGFSPEKVTVKHLLAHTMGIDNDPLVMTTAYTGMNDLKTREKLVQASYPDDEAPLNSFDYSNVGYNILSVWVDNKGKHNWQDLMQKNVFTPLKSERTSAYISAAAKNNWELAKPYSFRTGDDKPLYLSKQDNTMHSAGGMISSARDMANFLIVQLNDGKLDGKQVFPASVIQKSQQQITSATGNNRDFKRTGYAWGWFIGPYMDETLYHHFGGYSGTHTHLSFMPEKNIGIVVLNNEDTVSWEITRFVARGIYAALLNKQPHSEEAEQKATAFTEPDSIRVELIPNRGEVLQFQKNGEKVSGFSYQGTVFEKL